jgi:hypothetical protein
MHVPSLGTRWQTLQAGMASSLSATISMLRGLLLFLSGRPRTLLRALCIAAFDAIHRLRNGKRLSMRDLKMLAALLDLGACANAAFDRKKSCRQERRVIMRSLEEAGIGVTVAEYLRRLGRLEGGRPLPGGDRSRFQRVSLYREAIVRLSLGMVAIAPRGNQSLDEAIAATHGDGDLNLLFRIAMQCQIIDDVLDYSQDSSAGLPSFLTACSSLPQALEQTRRAALGYADDCHRARAAEVLPLRVALFGLSLCSRLAVSLRGWRARVHA